MIFLFSYASPFFLLKASICKKANKKPFSQMGKDNKDKFFIVPLSMTRGTVGTGFKQVF